MRGEEIFPPAQEFGKRSDIFQILMPTAPTRIKSLPRAQGKISGESQTKRGVFPVIIAALQGVRKQK